MGVAKITNVNITIRPKNDKKDQRVLGFAEVVVEDSLVIKNIKIVKTTNSGGRVLSFPAQLTKDSKKRYDLCYPINRETREHFEKVIFNAYDKLKEAQPLE